MQTRSVDFLSDREYRALQSSQADRKMFAAGVSCMTIMLVLSVAFMML